MRDIGFMMGHNTGDHMQRRTFIQAIGATGLGWPLAQAAAWPERPITFICPWPAGGTADATMRALCSAAAKVLGQPIAVENRAGAAGMLGLKALVSAKPDGYTVGQIPISVTRFSQLGSVQIDPLKDLAYLARTSGQTFGIAVRADSPWKTLKELVAHAKANPKMLNYAAGNTFALVGSALFAINNGITMQAVTFKSEPDALVDLLSGRIHLMFSTSTIAGPQVREGKLRVLATTLPERSPLMPDVPSFPESGQAKFPIGPWFALVGPAGLPRDVVTRMNKEMVATLAKPAVKEAMLRHGFMAKSSTPEALTAYMKDQLAIWKTALKSAGVEPQ